jgi:high-affinity Fe2+/Pb2+ permease
MEEEYSLNKTADHLRQYAESKIELIRLDIAERIVSTVSSLSSIILITCLSLFVLLFLSIGIALWINKKYVDSSMGFFIIGAAYLLITLILVLFREKIVKLPVINILLSKLYPENEN